MHCKLHSKTSRNLFPPRCIPFIYFLSLLLYVWSLLSCSVSVVWKVGAPQSPPAFLVTLIRFFSALNLEYIQMTLSHLNSVSTKTLLPVLMPQILFLMQGTLFHFMVCLRPNKSREFGRKLPPPRDISQNTFLS